jgi:ferric-dicitrate binding protein FerR (iron transport regulator)
MDDSQYDTNLGWWTDKPDRKSHRSERAPRQRQMRRRRACHVWLSAALVVGLMVALGWSIKSLAGW